MESNAEYVITKEEETEFKKQWGVIKHGSEIFYVRDLLGSWEGRAIPPELYPVFLLLKEYKKLNKDYRYMREEFKAALQKVEAVQREISFHQDIMNKTEEALDKLLTKDTVNTLKRD